ncbi:MAG: hypothetical protein SFZ24_02015 [Planctomycetota bacterium]|nr:hypothetical protein [Planctomycetota bacterium]
MAEKAPAPAPAPAAEAAPPKKGLPVKTIAAVAVLLVVEAVVVIGVVKVLGKPSEVKGVELEHAEHDDSAMLVEIPLLHEKFTNNSSGRVWMWDTEVILKVKKKHAGEPEAEGGEKKDDGHGGGKEEAADAHAAEKPAGMTVREEMKQRMAEIRTGVGAIVSAAQHPYFTEPGRETLSRQILEYLRGVFGQDAEGHERIEEVLIPRCLGFPADY